MNHKTLAVGPVALVLIFGVGSLLGRDLSLVVKQQPVTKDLQIVLENRSAVAMKYCDSLPAEESVPPFIWCQFAKLDKNRIVRRESQRILLLAKSSGVVRPRPRTLNAGERVSQIVRRDHLWYWVEDIIISDSKNQGFNAIRFVVSISRNTAFSKWVSGTSEYLNLADYRTDGKR